MAEGGKDELGVVRGIVRGDTPPTAVADAGYQLSESNGRWHLARGRGRSADARARCPATASDVARGLLANWADPERLAAWGFLVLSLTNAGYGDHPDGAALRDAVWRAAYRMPLPPDARELALRLAGADSA